MAIDIRSPAIDRSSGYNLAQTLVNKNNVAFELIDEMTNLIQCKVGFKARNFRSGVII